MSEKYQFYPYPPLPPLLRGGKLIKVPLFKGDLGGSTSVLCNRKKFSDILLRETGLHGYLYHIISSELV